MMSASEELPDARISSAVMIEWDSVTATRLSAVREGVTTKKSFRGAISSWKSLIRSSAASTTATPVTNPFI